ncbi:hypothetical protein [Microbulbifer hainanensis]|uniref:hypothetical protein n=1 Tax=Microbulbifer hainanensis TaxID=2735675 RepID=UPI00186723A1|nr:hypothetical protein [Microbulbifer hainanensis]
MKRVTVLFFIFLSSITSVFVVQMMITKIWNIYGVSWGPGNLPVEPNQQIAMLSTTFVAGLFAPIVAIVIYRKIPLSVISAICAFGMAIDLYAALVPLASLPVWFKFAFVMSVPLQVLAGTKIGVSLLALAQSSAKLS